jgi:hypothetical protein
MDKNAKIFVAGHRGMVGSALVRRLNALGYHDIITRSRSELDLLNQPAVHTFLQAEKPDYIYIAAAKVGGIQANNVYRADGRSQPDPRRTPGWRSKPDVPGLQLHLPQDGAAAHA